MDVVVADWHSSLITHHLSLVARQEELRAERLEREARDRRREAALVALVRRPSAGDAQSVLPSKLIIL